MTVQKVLIVRCDYCRSPLRNTATGGHGPGYFYSLASARTAAESSGWSYSNRGALRCADCTARDSSFDLTLSGLPPVGGEQ